MLLAMVATTTTFVEGKLVFYDGRAEPFSDLGGLLELAWVRQNQGEMIRQVELGGIDERGSAIHAVFDFNSVHSSDHRHKAGVASGRQRLLGEILVEDGVVTAEGLARALEAQRDPPGDERIGKVLIRLGLATAAQIYTALSKQYGIP